MAKRDKREFADMFKALGDPTRLKIYQFLRGRCWPHAADEAEEKWIENGPTVSEVCTTVTGSKKITSKVSQHLKELRIAGLITIERRGKNMICGVNHSAAEALVALLNSVDKVEAVAEIGAPVEAVAVVDEVQASPAKPSRKKVVVVDAPVVEVELVKPKRKVKAALNGNQNSAESVSAE